MGNETIYWDGLRGRRKIASKVWGKEITQELNVFNFPKKQRTTCCLINSSSVLKLNNSNSKPMFDYY